MAAACFWCHGEHLGINCKERPSDSFQRRTIQGEVITPEQTTRAIQLFRRSLVKGDKDE